MPLINMDTHPTQNTHTTKISIKKITKFGLKKKEKEKRKKEKSSNELTRPCRDSYMFKNWLGGNRPIHFQDLFSP